MHPVLIEIWKLRIYSYGFMFALSFFVGIWLAGRRAEKVGIAKQVLYDLCIVIIIAAVIGSRCLYIFSHRDHFNNILDIIALWQGGATLYGGFILAIAGAVIFVRLKGLSFFRLADICSPSMALGIFITRIGCFMSGCCFGLPTKCPIGVVFPPNSPAGYTFPGVHIHPTQLYSSLYGLVIFALLLLVDRRNSFDGRTFGFFCIFYGVARIVVDTFRFYEDSAMIGGVVTFSQLLSLGLIVTGILLLVLLPPRLAGSRGDSAG
ncbi:MAG: prolipoprotein diacylglyceryl transferase [Candidatus Krumholzibacteria bacterium]|nr:prolipoprotein diacylglyceryl transferase [Candidatus Krumholzibacteria bacterium]